jgi:microcystin-dependent protein
MQIQGNQALYSLIGTTFGGNGTTTFNLPDLRGRVPVHQNLADPSGNYVRGKASGVETVALTGTQIPPHQHTLNVIASAGTVGAPANNFLSGAGASTPVPTPPNLFASPGTAPVALNPATISTTPAATGHNNMQPFLVLNFCIAIAGLYPTRN